MFHLITICHKCEHRQRNCAGSCLCVPGGQDIIQHAQTGKCPLGKFDEALADPNFKLPSIESQPKGVGAHLTDILRELDIADKEGCRCHEHAAEMDAKGVEWCKSNRETIVGWLKDEAAKKGWVERMAASVKAAAKGYTSFGSLVDEATRRAS